MPRPQFTLRALLVAMLVVAAFFGGMAVQKQIDKRKAAENAVPVLRQAGGALLNRKCQHPCHTPSSPGAPAATIWANWPGANFIRGRDTVAANRSTCCKAANSNSRRYAFANTIPSTRL
jgi:cytochrome c5